MAVTHDVGARSGGFISGLPAAATFVEELDPEAVLREVVASVLEEGQSHLRKQLERDAQWRPYADKIEISFVDGEFSYEISDRASKGDRDAMIDLEYGTPEQAPVPMLRKHSLRLSRLTSKRAQDALEEVTGLGS